MKRDRAEEARELRKTSDFGQRIWNEWLIAFLVNPCSVSLSDAQTTQPTGSRRSPLPSRGTPVGPALLLNKSSIWDNLGMKKPPKIPEPIDMLRDLNVRVRALGNLIQNLLERYDEPTLIPRIIEKAKKLKSKRISASWLQRNFRIGYSRAMKLKDQLAEMEVIEPNPTGNGRSHKLLVK